LLCPSIYCVKVFSEDISPLKEKSFDGEPGGYGNQGVSFKVFQNNDKENNKQLISSLQKVKILKSYFFCRL